MNNVNIPKRAYHHGNLRAALIQATLRAIAEDGPDGFTLRDVARRAGVSPAAPYRHFQDKDELFAAVSAECAERVAGIVLAAVAQVPPDDPLAQLRQVGIAFVEFAVANPEHFRALNVPGVASRVPVEQQQRRDAWDAARRRALADAQEAGTIARMPLDDLMLAATAIVHGLSHLIVEGQLGEVSPERARQLAIAVTDVLSVGLLPRADGDSVMPLPSAAPRPAAPPPDAPSGAAPAPRPRPRPTAAVPRKGMRSVRPQGGVR